MHTGAPDAVYDIGDRVQITPYGFTHRRGILLQVRLDSVGLVQGYRTPLKGVGRVLVRWLQEGYPDHFDHVMLKTHIEPYGSPREDTP